jgi:hypothetical protein
LEAYHPPLDHQQEEVEEQVLLLEEELEKFL